MNLNDHVISGKGGPCFSVPGEWRDSYRSFMLETGISELMVNSTHGFLGENVKFLEHLPFLSALTLLAFSVDDVSPIEALHSLSYLNLAWTGKNSPNFANLPYLEYLGIRWRRRAESLFDSKSITSLYLSNYPGKNCEPLGAMTQLTSLKLSQSAVSEIAGLTRLSELRVLGLYYLRKLVSIEGVDALANLEELDIETCKKVNDLTPVSKLTRLVKISFSNCGPIVSIEPLRNLRLLETVHFWESTDVLDGDLSPLTNLPYVKDVRFQNRKHYSLKRELFAPFGTAPEYPKLDAGLAE